MKEEENKEDDEEDENEVEDEDERMMEFTAMSALDWMVFVWFWKKEEGKETSRNESMTAKQTIHNTSRHMELALMIANH